MKFPGMIDYQIIAKKYIFDILQERYKIHEDVIDRMSHYLITEKDTKGFCQVIADAYSKGYMKAVNDYKEQLRKIGYNVDVNIKS